MTKLNFKSFDPSPFVFSLDGIEFITSILKHKDLPHQEGQLLFEKFISAALAAPNGKFIGIADPVVFGKVEKDTNPIIKWYINNLEIEKPSIVKLLDQEQEGKKIKHNKDQKLLIKYKKSDPEEQKKQTAIKIKFNKFEHIIEFPKPQLDYSIPIKQWTSKYIQLNDNLLAKTSNTEPDNHDENKHNSLLSVFKEHHKSLTIQGIKYLKDGDLESLGNILPNHTESLYQSLIDNLLVSYHKSINKKTDSIGIEYCFDNKPVATIYHLRKNNQIEWVNELALSGLNNHKFNIETKNDLLLTLLQNLIATYDDNKCKELFLSYLEQKDFHGTLSKLLVGSTIKTAFSAEEIEYINEILNIGNFEILNTSYLKSMMEIQNSHPKTKQEISNLIKKGKGEVLLSYYIDNIDLDSIELTLKAITEYKYNKTFFLNHALEQISLIDNIENAEKLYNCLKNSFTHENDIEFITRAQALHIAYLKNIIKTSNGNNQIESISIEELKKQDEPKKQDEDSRNSTDIDESALAKEAVNFINECTPQKTVIESSPKLPQNNPWSHIHKAHILRKKLLSNKKVENNQEKVISWSIKGLTYKFEPIEDGKIKQIKTSFGTQIYTHINENIFECLSHDQVTKFKAASGHWANAFFNKSGVKSLHSKSSSDNLCGYEVKINKDGSRLFTNKLYKNIDDQSLLIFDTLITKSNTINGEVEIIHLGDIVDE